MVQFYPWFKFYFPLFQTCYHTFQYTKTKEKKILTKDKIEPQHLCQPFGSLEKSTILFELSNFTHQLWCLCKPNRLYHSCHMKGKNIIWWSLALLSFSWDRSLLVTKSWYSRSCFSGMIQGGRMSGVQIPLHQIWQIFERKLLEMWDHILLLKKYIHLAWINPLLKYVRVQL